MTKEMLETYLFLNGFKYVEGKIWSYWWKDQLSVEFRDNEIKMCSDKIYETHLGYQSAFNELEKII